VREDETSIEIRSGASVHFVGIGGVSMSALAEWLHERGCRVSGSDREASAITGRLVKKGISVAIGHRARDVDDADLVVFTPAVGEDNAAVVEARRRNVPTLRRRELLREVTRGKRLVAVAGTHGKTTTTGMVASICEAGGLDPTAFVGGVMQGWGTNLRLGSDELWVMEADEYDRAFLELTPTVAVVTGVEADHLDQYGDEAAVHAAFEQFLDGLTSDGTAVICADSAGAQGLRAEMDRVTRYGIESDEADLRAEAIWAEGFGSRFGMTLDGASIGRARLRVPGRHNVQNALGAAGAAFAIGLEWPAVREGLEAFDGVSRRFEILGEAAGTTVVSDYAHHPTEIRATLAAAREGWQGRVTAVFQPHLFTRTRDFADDFGAALALADRVWLTEIYPAREEPIPGITGSLIAQKVRGAGHRDVQCVSDLNELAAAVASDSQAGEMVLGMGAGSVGKVANRVLEILREQGAQT